MPWTKIFNMLVSSLRLNLLILPARNVLVLLHFVIDVIMWVNLTVSKLFEGLFVESCPLTRMEYVDTQMFKSGRWENHDYSLVYMAAGFTKWHEEWLLMLAIISIFKKNFYIEVCTIKYILFKCLMNLYQMLDKFWHVSFT